MDSQLPESFPFKLWDTEGLSINEDSDLKILLEMVEGSRKIEASYIPLSTLCTAKSKLLGFCQETILSMTRMMMTCYFH